MAKIILNHQIIDKQDYIEPQQYVYEVVRLLNGSALFLEEHIARLSKSLEQSQTSYLVDLEYVKETIRLLIQYEGLHDQNIKLVIAPLTGSQPLRYELACYYIPSHYPSDLDYRLGVPAKKAEFMRHNPEIKKATFELQNIRARIEKEKIFDFLCYDQEGIVTEGTKTNVFFLKDGVLRTAPTNQVLAGVTRSKIIQIARSLKGLAFVEEPLHESEIETCDAVFFSGTSIGLLPISKVDDHIFSFNDVTIFKQLQKAYNELVHDYVKHNLISVQ